MINKHVLDTDMFYKSHQGYLNQLQSQRISLSSDNSCIYVISLHRKVSYVLNVVLTDGPEGADDPRGAAINTFCVHEINTE